MFNPLLVTINCNFYNDLSILAAKIEALNLSDGILKKMNNDTTVKRRYSSTPFDGKVIEIRPECLTPFSEHWSVPNGDEVREIIRRTGLTGGQVAKKVGLTGSGASRTVRRWVSGETDISYAIWGILCDLAGIKSIWRETESD